MRELKGRSGAHEGVTRRQKAGSKRNSTARLWDENKSSDEVLQWRGFSVVRESAVAPELQQGRVLRQVGFRLMEHVKLVC